MAAGKDEVVTFKVDAAVMEQLRMLPNRSQFIRTAILQALENACPLCGGAGVLTPHQKEHWIEFERDHSLAECGECQETHLVCDRSRRAKRVHASSQS